MQELQLLWLHELFERDGVDDVLGVLEAGVDLDPRRVAGQEERRVLEIRPVLIQLLPGGFEVFVLALVLEGEEATLPDVREAVRTAALLGPLLETEELPLRIERRRLPMPHQLAQVEKMLLRRRPFLERRGLPLANEVAGGHLGVDSTMISSRVTATLRASGRVSTAVGDMRRQ